MNVLVALVLASIAHGASAMKISVEDGPPIEVRAVFDGPVTKVAAVGAIVAPWGGGGVSLYSVRSPNAEIQLEESGRDLMSLSNLLPPGLRNRPPPWAPGWGDARNSTRLDRTIAGFLDSSAEPAKLRKALDELLKSSASDLTEVELTFLTEHPDFAFVDRASLRRLFIGIAWNSLVRKLVASSIAGADSHEVVLEASPTLGFAPLQLPPLETIFRKASLNSLFFDLSQLDGAKLWEYRQVDLCTSAVKLYGDLISGGAYRRTASQVPEVDVGDQISAADAKAHLSEVTAECQSLNDKVAKHLFVLKLLHSDFELEYPKNDNNKNLKIALQAAAYPSPDELIKRLSARFWVYLSDFRDDKGNGEDNAIARRTAQELALTYRPRFSFHGRFFLVSERSPPLFYAGAGLVTWTRPSFAEERPQAFLSPSGTRPQDRHELQLRRLEAQFTNDLETQAASVIDATSALYAVRSSETAYRQRQLRRAYIFDEVQTDESRLSAAREQLLQAYGTGIQWAPEPAQVIESSNNALALKGDLILSVVPILRKRFKATELRASATLKAGEQYVVTLADVPAVPVSDRMREAFSRLSSADRSSLLEGLKSYISNNRRYILAVSKAVSGTLSTTTEGEIRDSDSQWVSIAQLGLPASTIQRVLPILESSGVASKTGNTGILYLELGTLRAKATYQVNVLGELAR